MTILLEYKIDASDVQRLLDRIAICGRDGRDRIIFDLANDIFSYEDRIDWVRGYLGEQLGAVLNKYPQATEGVRIDAETGLQIEAAEDEGDGEE